MPCVYCASVNKISCVTLERPAYPYYSFHIDVCTACEQKLQKGVKIHNDKHVCVLCGNYCNFVLYYNRVPFNVHKFCIGIKNFHKQKNDELKLKNLKVKKDYPLNFPLFTITTPYKTYFIKHFQLVNFKEEIRSMYTGHKVVSYIEKNKIPNCGYMYISTHIKILKSDDFNILPFINITRKYFHYLNDNFGKNYSFNINNHNINILNLTLRQNAIAYLIIFIYLRFEICENNDDGFFYKLPHCIRTQIFDWLFDEKINVCVYNEPSIFGGILCSSFDAHGKYNEIVEFLNGL